MSLLSPLQLLPLHVVQRIVVLVIGNFHGVYSFDWPRLKPLLLICQNFYKAAHPLYYRYIELQLDDQYFSEPMMHYLRTGYRSSDNLCSSTLLRVQWLGIKLDERAIYSGKALRMLSSALYEDYVFPQARRFNLTLSWDNYNDGDSDVYGNIDSLAAKANLSAFVQRIKYMVPLVNEVSVNPDDHHLRFGGIASHHLGDVISQLYCLANRVSYYCRDYSYIIKEVMFDEICNLASVVYDGEGLGNQFTHLARQNAPTLQSLTIYTHDEELSTSNLIRDVGGSCVVYPCLRKLKLSMEYDIDESISFGSNVPVLFPRLQHLGLGGNYAFDKYVFFKGNAASLECMSVSLDSSMVHMIRRYNLFTPTSHPNLRNVKVTFCSDFIPTLFPAATDAIQFALDIGPGAPVREISTSIFAKTLLPVYPFLGLHTCTQVLSLGHTPLVLWDAIVLIQSLHLLTDLHAGAVSLGTIPDGVTRKALPAYVISKYAPMGQRFRCWHLVNICGNSVSSTVECLLLLALVCPNFDYSSPFVFRCESYRKPMQDALASDMFKDHASRLQRRQ